MKLVITGKSFISSAQADEAMETLADRVKQMRFVHDLEKLAVVAAGCAMLGSGLECHHGDSDIGIYMGIDDAIEDIKDEYFTGALADGLWGASPLLFPFTSPNTLAAQISIAFGLRGEGLVMPVKSLCPDMIKYSAGSIEGGYAKKAISGAISLTDRSLSIDAGRYSAGFVIIEKEADAVRRGAKIYNTLKAGNIEDI